MNLNVIYRNETVRVIMTNSGLYYVEGANKWYKKLENAIKKANNINTANLLFEMLFQEEKK